MNGLDLFSGIGGISLALKEYARTVCYCETDRYAQGVLLSRMQSGDIDRAPIWDDVRTLKASMLPEIDIITGGFPCQDISVAGRGAGLEGERSGLFFEIIRLAKETRAPFVFLENVPAIRTRGLREVVRAFTDLRYDCRWTRVSAAELGAPHRRERWFLLAHSECRGIRNESGGWSRESGKAASKPQHYGEEKLVANTSGERLEGQWEKSRRTKKKLNDIGNHSRWFVEPNVDRVVNGLPYRVDRIKCLGNSVVPMQAQKAFERLIGIK